MAVTERGDESFTGDLADLSVALDVSDLTTGYTCFCQTFDRVRLAAFSSRSGLLGYLRFRGVPTGEICLADVGVTQCNVAHIAAVSCLLRPP